ncbi:MAG: c-type cytochrome [Candidatus Sulfobium sp.]|jgi:ubiquinol-cytochrome c reductase cytochrome b subunit
MNRLVKWFTDRWPFYQLRDLLLKEDIPGGSSFAYTIGSSILMIFALQVASGILQLFYYVPTTDHAYNSVSYLRTQVPFGWLVHNMHYWGASAMVFLVALHMVRVYTWGAYKKTPLTWFIGIALLLTTMALSFTGAPLIWDQKGYYAGEVGTSIAGEVPIIGNLLEIIMRGGQTMTQLTLSRFFAFHVGVFVPILALLIGMHIASFRTSGVAGPWDREKQKKTGPFWPDQAFKDLTVATVVLLALIALSVYFPVPYAGMADTINTTYVPKPEWNFLFIYQALKYFKGPLEPVGAAGVPAVFVLLLIIVPLIDRNPKRNPFHRPFAMACLVLYAGLIVTLSIIGYLSPGLAQPATGKKKEAKKTEEKKAAPRMSPEAKRGEKVFQKSGCRGCHKVHGKGGSVGPELTAEALKGKSRKWLMDQITSSSSHFPSMGPNTGMTEFTSMGKKDLHDLVSYLMSIAEGEAPAPEASPAPSEAGRKSPGIKKGEQIFQSKGCTGCHKVFGKGGSVGPELSGGTLKGKSRQWIEDQIRNPKSHFPNSVMPSFSGMSKEDIDDLVSYLMSMVGRSSPDPAAAASSEQDSKDPAGSDQDASHIKKGKELFQSQGCSGCHKINGKGGTVDPELSGDTLKDRNRKWIEDQIRNPKSHFPNSIMPSFSGLSKEDVNSLASYLKSLSGQSPSGSAAPSPAGSPQARKKQQAPAKQAETEKPEKSAQPPKAGEQPPSSAGGPSGPPPEQKALKEQVGKSAFIIGSAENGASLYKEECVSCHGPDGKDNVPNPGSKDGKVPPLNPIDRELYSPDPKVFVEHIDKIIQHGSTPEGPHPALHMPAWGDSRSLTQQEIANLEAYILQLNGVDRGKIVQPGLEPQTFFFIVLGLFVVAALLAGGAWARRRKE